MVANIWPEEQFLQEILSTLNFAQRMGDVVNVSYKKNDKRNKRIKTRISYA